MELSSPASTVAVSPAEVDGEPKADADGGTTATGEVIGGVTGGAPPCAPRQGGRTQRRPVIAATDVNKLKAEFTKERAFDGMMFLLPVAECTIKISTKRFTPARSQRARIIQRQPLKWGAVTLALPEVTTDTAAREQGEGDG